MTDANQAPFSFPAAGGGGGLDKILSGLGERAKRISTSRPFLAFCILAAVLIGIYYFIVATPLYVSNASFSIRGREATTTNSLLGLVGGTSTDAAETAEVSTYITSPEMLHLIDKQFNIRKIYSQPRLDLFNYMPRTASEEDFLTYYKKMVDVRIDHDTNIVSVAVRSYDRASAQQIADAILKHTGDYVDSLSAAIRRDTLKASEDELQKSEKAVRDSRLAMTRYRTETGLLDPTITATAESANVMTLEQEIIQTQADLASLSTYSTATNPAVVQMQAKIKVLQQEIVAAQQRLATKSRPDTLAQKVYVYEGLMVQNEYAEKQLVAALSAYDSARALASQRERFLVRVVNPNLPDDATEPQRLLSFLEALLIAITAYGIIALAIAGVRDHQGI